MKNSTIEWVSSAERFCALSDEWTELLDHSSSNSLFMTWAWQYTWWKHLAEGSELAILLVWQDKRLIAIAPLVVRPADFSRLLPFRAIEILGTGSVGSDYLSFIVRQGDEDTALPVIAQQLCHRRFVLEFSNTERDSDVMTHFAHLMRRLDYHVTRQTQSFSPFIDLHGIDWKSYMSGSLAGPGSRFFKKLRKLHRTYDAQLLQVLNECDRPAALQIMMDLHMKRWQEKGGSNALDTGNLRNFHTDFSKIALQNNWLRLFVLWLDGEPASAVYGFFYQRIFYYYQAGFDPRFSAQSVGYLSIGMTLESACAEGATEYDFLHGEEEYKYAWSNNERELVRLRLFPPSLSSYLCRQLLSTRESMKRLVRVSAPVHGVSRLLQSTITRRP